MRKQYKKKYGVRQSKEFKEQILEELKNNNGLITITLKKLGISRYYYNKWISEDKEFKKYVENIKKEQVDYVESKLFELIEQKDKSAIMFYLKTHSTDYIEKQSVDHNVGINQKLMINIIKPDELKEGKDFNKKYLNE